MLSASVCKSIVAMVNRSMPHKIGEEHGIHCMPCSSLILSGIQCMACSSRIVSEMMCEILTIKKCDFLKPIINFQIIKFSVYIYIYIYLGGSGGGGGR